MSELRMSEDLSFFRDQCHVLGLDLANRQVDQFLTFYQMLVEKNKVMNLTAITQFDQVITKHFLDSLLLARHTDLSKTERLLDLGTGAGFPGIPLKIVFPHIEITLADSLKKRLVFLDEVIKELGLQKIETLHGRAEDLGRSKERREHYDLVVSRAVANLSTLSEYCLPLVKVGGRFVSYKAADVTEEQRAAKRAIGLLGGICEGAEGDLIPGTDLRRSFVVISKVRPTPSSYPRKAGMPSKLPLS